LASWAHAKDKHGESRALFCRKLVEAQEARDQQDGTRSKNNGGGTLNHANKEVVVNIWVEESRGSRGHKERREQVASRRKIKPPVLPFAR
jgi:hypothetical protein